MKRLTDHAFEAARNWLAEHGRPLERAQFAFAFENGSPDAVLETLSAYQNADGGYGHRLEPDHTDNDSTVLNTLAALTIHRRLSTPSDHPQITAAVSYLVSSYDPHHRVWPLRQPNQPGSQGPPWFTTDSMDTLRDAFGGFRINPTAEAIGFLYDHLTGEQPDWFKQAIDHLTPLLLDPNTAYTHHDLMCAASLLQASKLPAGMHQPLKEKLQTSLLAVVEPDVSRWHNYVLRPTLVIDGPAHPLAGCVPDDLIEADLAFEIDRVAKDGAWHPFWDWGQDSPGWREAECAWSSYLTERTLRVLAAFDRIDPN